MPERDSKKTQVYGPLSDQQLTELLKGGDQLAYAQIYERYKRTLYLFAVKRLDDAQEAEDVLHELFMSLWNKREQLDEQRSLVPYLFNAVRYRIINIFARRKLSSRYLDSFNDYLENEYGEETADHLVRHNELSALIEKEVSALPRKMREVFELSRKEGYSRADIAKYLDLSEETVKSHMHHALKILKDRLGKLMFLVFF